MIELFIEFLPYVAVSIVSYWIGSHVRAVRFMHNIWSNPDDFIALVRRVQDIKENDDLGLPEDAVEVRIEQENNIVYAYEKATGQFLAQAQSLHLAMVEAARLYPEKKFWHPELYQDSQKV